MRPERRIDIFCNLLANKWKEQGIDLRFTQFLINNGLQINFMGTDAWYMEEVEFIKKLFPDIDPREYLLWGTYGKDGQGPLKYILITEMETEHIEAILRDYKKKKQPLSELYLTNLKKELKERKSFQKKVLETMLGKDDAKSAIKALKNMPSKKELEKKYKKYTKKVDKKKKK